jgi:hypothetical protein
LEIVLHATNTHTHTQRGGGAKDVLFTLFFFSLPQIMILTSIFICNIFYNCFRRFLYSGDAWFESWLCHLLAVLTEVLCDFSQSFQANARIERKLCDEHQLTTHLGPVRRLTMSVGVSAHFCIPSWHA